jgi:hypothetical protein
MFWATLVISGQSGQVVEVVSLGCRREITLLHIVGYALAKRCHVKAPWNVGLVYRDKPDPVSQEPRASLTVDRR